MTEKKQISAFTIIVAFLCLAIVGIALLPQLALKLSPSKSLPSISISFNMRGNTARIVEMEATSKLESMLARVKGVRNMYSTSGNGWGTITVEIDKHTSIDVARFEVSSIIRQTWPELPTEVSYPVIVTNRIDESASRPFMSYTISAPAKPIVIQNYTENVIKTAFNDIKGLHTIDVGGASPMEWRLTYDNSLLQTVGVTIADIRDAVSQFYTTQFLGTTETEMPNHEPNWIRVMLSSGSKKNTFDPTAISVSNKDGTLIRLDHLVNVQYIEKVPSAYYRINGLNSIYLSFNANESANQLQLSENIKAKMKEVEKNLPPGFEIHSSYDATEYIQREIDKIYFRSGVTSGLLLLFVLLFTRNWRYLFLVTASLLVNLSVAIIFYFLLKVEIQLYSLAAITISLSLIIDNVIIVADHFLHRADKKAITSILAATLSTVGVLLMIFFLDERVKLNLQDFSIVMVINLLVSIAVAYFFVPSLMEYMSIAKSKTESFPFKRFSRKRLAVRFTSLYERLIRLLSTKKRIAFTFVVLLFGLPVFLLPEKIEKETLFAEKYNELMQNVIYKEQIKPVLTKALGGTLRLFSENVFQESYLTRNEETVLTVTASMPSGTQLAQMNELIIKMERYISSFTEVKQFQTFVSNAQRASIDIFFKDEFEQSSFPYRLKEDIIGKALELGGGSWGVYGLHDQGFSNDVRDKAGQFRLKLNGYNYDELSSWANTLKDRLLKHRRIKEVSINASFSQYKDDYEEYAFLPNREALAARGILPAELFHTLYPIFTKDMWVASVYFNQEREDILLNSKEAQHFDIWSLKHVGQYISSRLYKLDELATIEKQQTPREIAKENQQYRLVLQYDYIGGSEQSIEILDKELDQLKRELPMGYTFQKEEYFSSWDNDDNKNYFLIAMLAVIVFLVTSILFNSIKQPFAIIFIIPISFIGVFVTFYCFQLNFDQGGFASFIILSGITANAGIYVVNEYNRIKKQKPRLSSVRAYLKAWNSKIAPIFLTIISTIIGFIPFLINAQNEAFWFPLAAGTIGGLLVSLIGTWVFLPLLILKRNLN